MLIGAGQEIDIEAALLFVAMYDIGDDGRVEMPEMRKTIGVIDRCCDVKALHRKR